jgi:fibronectin-binding autotransporter adhesin
MNTKPLVRFALGFITLLVALSASAQLQYYWDATSPIMSSPGSGGTGSWSASTADWWVSGSSDSVWANGNIANFAGTAGTVTLTGAVTANGLTFATSGYTIATGNTLTLAGPPIISLPGGATAINCIIAGSSGLTISGSGTLTLTNINTYTGGTTNGSGCTLTIGGAGKLGSGSYAGAIANAGTFDWGSSASQTFSGAISGVGNIIQGGGTLTLSANNTFTGTTTINSGKTLTVTGAGKLGGGVYAANITNNGTFNFNATNSETLNGIISGSGSLSVNPGGNLGNLLTLNGANTYAGATTIADAGQIIINSDSGLGTPPASYAATQLLFEYGFLKAAGSFTLNSNRGIYLAAGSQGIGASIQVNPSDTLTLTAPIAGAAGLGVIFGSGEPTFGFGTNLLTVSNTYTGPTAISTGRVLLGRNGALPTGTTLVMAPDDAGGTFFDLGGYTQTIGPLSTTNTFYAPAGVGNGTPTIILNGALTVLQTNIATVFCGLITGSGSLTINGNASGTLSLSNYANTYTGLTTINGGTLDITNGASIAGNVTVNGGTLELDNDTALSTTSTLTMSASVVVDLNYSGTQTVAALNFGATPQATGLWGAMGNAGATYTDSRFTGPGLLLVCAAPQTITPATPTVCAGSTTTASVTATAGATYSWTVANGTIISGANSSTVTYSVQQAYSSIYLDCVVTSSCGVTSPGNQNVMVPVDVCGLVVQASNNVAYSAANGATITANGIPGATWYLNASTNVNTPLPWPTLQSGTISSSPFTITDPTATNYGQQFYYLTNATSP